MISTQHLIIGAVLIVILGILIGTLLSRGDYRNGMAVGVNMVGNLPRHLVFHIDNVGKNGERVLLVHSLSRLSVEPTDEELLLVLSQWVNAPRPWWMPKKKMRRDDYQRKMVNLNGASWWFLEKKSSFATHSA